MKPISFLVVLSLFSFHAFGEGREPTMAPPRSAFVHVDKIHINEFHKDRFFILTNTTGYSEIEVIIVDHVVTRSVLRLPTIANGATI